MYTQWKSINRNANDTLTKIILTTPLSFCLLKCSLCRAGLYAYVAALCGDTQLLPMMQWRCDDLFCALSLQCCKSSAYFLVVCFYVRVVCKYVGCGLSNVGN